MAFDATFTSLAKASTLIPSRVDCTNLDTSFFRASGNSSCSRSAASAIRRCSTPSSSPGRILVGIPALHEDVRLNAVEQVTELEPTELIACAVGLKGCGQRVYRVEVIQDHRLAALFRDIAKILDVPDFPSLPARFRGSGNRRQAVEKIRKRRVVEVGRPRKEGDLVSSPAADDEEMPADLRARSICHLRTA